MPDETPTHPPDSAFAIATTTLVTPEILDALLAAMDEQETPTEKAGPLADALFAAIDKAFRDKFGPLPYVRHTLRGICTAVGAGTCTMSVAGIDHAIPDVRYGPNKPTVGDPYHVRFPVTLPPEGARLIDGPVPFGQPWIKVPGGVALYYGVVVPRWPADGGVFDPHGDDLRVYKAQWPPTAEDEPQLLATIPPIETRPATPPNPPTTVPAYVVGADSAGNVYVAWPMPAAPTPPDQSTIWLKPHPPGTLTNSFGQVGDTFSLDNTSDSLASGTPQFPCKMIPPSYPSDPLVDIPLAPGAMPWWVDLTPGAQRIGTIKLNIGAQRYAEIITAKQVSPLESFNIAEGTKTSFHNFGAMRSADIGYLVCDPDTQYWSPALATLHVEMNSPTALERAGLSGTRTSYWINALENPIVATFAASEQIEFPVIAHVLGMRLWGDGEVVVLVVAVRAFLNAGTARGAPGVPLTFHTHDQVVSVATVPPSTTHVQVGLAASTSTFDANQASGDTLDLRGDGVAATGVYVQTWDGAGPNPEVGAPPRQAATFGTQPFFKPLEAEAVLTTKVARGGGFTDILGFAADRVVGQDLAMTNLLATARRPSGGAYVPQPAWYSEDAGATWTRVPYPGGILPDQPAEGFAGNVVIV